MLGCVNVHVASLLLSDVLCVNIYGQIAEMPSGHGVCLRTGCIKTTEGRSL